MKNYKWSILLLTVSTILLIVLTKGKELMESGIQKVWDIVSERRINTLHPLIRDKARGFINEVERQTGIRLRVTAARRTYDEQNHLYAKGRTEPGKIVTNARGGESFHNFALALDVVEILNGAANWQTDWNRIGAIGKQFGFEWGGDWKSFKDKPHFQYSAGKSLAQLQTIYQAGRTSQGYVQIA